MNQLFRLQSAKHAGWLVAVVLVNSKTECTPSLVSESLFGGFWAKYSSKLKALEWSARR